MAAQLRSGEMPSTPRSYYIAKRDLKPKYQEARNGVTKIEAYSRAIEVALWTIEQDFDVSIGVEDMQGDTLKFTITADSHHQRDNAIQHIQGEFCDVSAQPKYDSNSQLPSPHVRGISGSSKAMKVLSPEDQDRLQNEHNPVLLTEEALRKHDIKHMTGPCELRQFGCGPCDHFWWRIVPVSKKVSRCRECHIRYDALQRNKEFGIGRYRCTKPSCRREFYAKCQATDTLVCRKCKSNVSKPYIHPRWRKRRHVPRPRSGSRQGRPLNPSARTFVPGSQLQREPSFEPVSSASATLRQRMGDMTLSSPRENHRFTRSTASKPERSQPQANPAARAVAPTRRRKVINASREHNSSGSTMSTFITQMDNGDFDEVPLDYDSDEGGVGACRFECDCGKKYTVLCEMTDTAECFWCHHDNEPMGWAPPREIDRESSLKHSCSKCRGRGNCPNLQALGTSR